MKIQEQAADTAVAIHERVNPVEPRMMNRGVDYRVKVVRRLR